VAARAGAEVVPMGSRQRASAGAVRGDKPWPSSPPLTGSHRAAAPGRGSAPPLRLATRAPLPADAGSQSPRGGAGPRISRLFRLLHAFARDPPLLGRSALVP